MYKTSSKALTPFNQAWLNSRKSILKLLHGDQRTRQASGAGHGGSKAKQEPLDLLALMDKLKEVHDSVEQQLVEERRYGELQARDKDAAEGLLINVEEEMRRWKDAAERSEEAFTLKADEAAKLEVELREVREQLAEAHQRLQSAQQLVERETTAPRSPAPTLALSLEGAGLAVQRQTFGQHSVEEGDALRLAVGAAGVMQQGSPHALEAAADTVLAAQVLVGDPGEAAGDVVDEDGSQQATDASQQLHGVLGEGELAGEGDGAERVTDARGYLEKMFVGRMAVLKEMLSMEEELEALRGERQELIVMVAILTRQLRVAEMRNKVDAPTATKTSEY